jgi:LuxR family maltose regulon positive regulatory protein
LEESLIRTPSLTLVSAPPGFGKTTLLSEWLSDLRFTNNDLQVENEQIQNRKSKIANHQVAWVSLDEQDNDPVRFWSYLITALDKVQPGLETQVLPILQARQTPLIEETLTVLINTLTTAPQVFSLILDDYHLIEQEAIHQAFAFFLDHLPPQMHLILISRTDPPLPLTRFRVRNQLNEIRQSDLRFTPQEAADFLNQIMGLNLAPGDITALENRTEGWIAGLQLAALSMQGRRDVEGCVEAFSGSHRYIIDFLAVGVLSLQAAAIQAFLLRGSCVELVHGPLCDAVFGG